MMHGQHGLPVCIQSHVGEQVTFLGIVAETLVHTPALCRTGDSVVPQCMRLCVQQSDIG